LKGCDFIIKLEVSASEIDMSEGISAGNEALVMSERSASGIGGKNCALRASSLSEGVMAFPEGVTRLEIEGGGGGKVVSCFSPLC
jgi:hypothetical protein